MRIQVLGPLRVWRGGDEVDLGPPARRAVLGLLLLAGGDPVPRATLVDALWGDHPPPTAVNVLQTHVKHLRRLLEPDRAAHARSTVIPHLRGGYALRIDADLPRFRQLVTEANAAHRDGDHARVAALLAEALGLWHGQPLVDVPLLAEHPTLVALRAEKLVALGRYGDAMIATGRAAEVLPALTAIAAEQPLDEPVQARLIRAQHAVGQRAEAFATYRAVRDRLADELGVDPGPELQEAHLALLHGGEAAVAPRLVPAQLPPDVPGFTGRAAELSTLDSMARTVVTVSGAAGVGKTALVVHWAHRVRHRFPDGQLYANLRGPAQPVEILAQLLLALGVPAEQIPMDLEPASALYRTMLADRRVLVVLDNAARPSQVRPLLPASPGCLALVTSRDNLAGLVASSGARSLPLDVLAPEEAVALLTEILGPARVRAEPEAAGELAKVCVFLPLALRIAAANLTSHPARGIAEQVLELRDGNTLAAFEVHGDEETAVRTAFDLSYAALPADARRLFRLLGLVPGADIGTDAAAVLAGFPVARLLDRLAAAHLVEQHAPGRFRFHDLLRRYAVELLHHHGAEPSAARRLHDWYLATVDHAARLLYPHMLRLPTPTFDIEPPFTDRAGASAWLDAERANLVAAVRADGPPEQAWLLADALRGYFWLSQHRVDWLATASAGLAAARAGGDQRAQAAARLSLADLHQRQSRYRQAVEHYTHALTHARRADWLIGQAAVLGNLGCVYWQTGRLRPAVAHLSRALGLSQRTGQLAGQAVTLGNLGLVHWERGELRQAAQHCGQAFELYRQIGSSFGEAINLGNLARIRHALGEDVTALFTDALRLHAEVGDRYSEADTRSHLAETLRDGGRLDEALDHARAALALAQDIGAPRAEAEALHVLATVELAFDRREDAVRNLRAALDLARHSGDRYPECDAMIDLAVAAGDAGIARQALDMAGRSGYRALAGLALTALAEVAAADHRTEDALRHAHQALTVHQETGHVIAERHTRALLTRIGTTP